MRKFIFALAALAVSATCLVAPAQAQSDEAPQDPNLRQPQILAFDQNGTRVEIVIGQAAFGDALTALGAAQAAQGTHQEIIDQFWPRRNEIPPILLFEVARRAAEDGNAQLALDAYLLARARTLYDAMRCVDPSAMGVLDVVTGYAGTTVNEMMAEDLVRLEGALERLLANGEMFSGEASPWWACSYGDSAYYAAINNALMPGVEWLKLESRWEESRTLVRAYFDGDLNLIRATRAVQENGGE